MITNERREELAQAALRLYWDHNAEDLKSVLDLAFEQRKMDGRPWELADLLEAFAGKLRTIPIHPNIGEHL